MTVLILYDGIGAYRETMMMMMFLADRVMRDEEAG
jgi:hypothetical protein